MGKWSEAQKRYARSDKGRQARRRYQMSEKGRASRRAYLARRKAKLAEAKQNQAEEDKPVEKVEKEDKIKMSPKSKRS